MSSRAKNDEDLNAAELLLFFHGGPTAVQGDTAAKVTQTLPPHHAEAPAQPIPPTPTRVSSSIATPVARTPGKNRQGDEVPVPQTPSRSRISAQSRPASPTKAPDSENTPPRIAASAKGKQRARVAVQEEPVNSETTEPSRPKRSCTFKNIVNNAEPNPGLAAKSKALSNKAVMTKCKTPSGKAVATKVKTSVEKSWAPPIESETSSSKTNDPTSQDHPAASRKSSKRGREDENTEDVTGIPPKKKHICPRKMEQVPLSTVLKDEIFSAGFLWKTVPVTQQKVTLEDVKKSQEPTRCPECVQNISLTRISDMPRHINSCIAKTRGLERPFACLVPRCACPGGTTEENMKTHALNVHGHANGLSKWKPRPVSAKYVFRCARCMYFCTKKVTWNKHKCK